MSQKNARRTRQRLTEVRARQAASDRRRRTAVVTGGIALALGLAGGVVYGVLQAGGEDSPPAASSQGGGGWPAPPEDPGQGVKAAGLNLGPMGTAEHYHAHLDLFADGKPVPVPANIGVDARSGAMSAVHTHDTRGVIHVEAHAKGERYTLGQVFTQWGLRLSPTQAGPLKATGGKTLTAYVDGEKFSGDPAEIVLAPHRQIALVHGTPGTPFTPPSAYRFQPGE